MGNMKPRKSIKKSTKSRELGVILEHFDSKTELILEGQQALDRKIDLNHQEFKEFREEVNYKFDVVFDELHMIRNDLKEKVGRDEFAALEKRVMYLEKKASKTEQTGL